MNPHQKTYLTQCYQEYQDSFDWCRHCGPDRKPVLKRWTDAVHSVVDYLNSIAPTGHTIQRHPVPNSDVFAWRPARPWQAGVFEADSYDSDTRGWYWRLPDEPQQSAHHTSDPVSAIIEAVTAYEEVRGADPDAPTLLFKVYLPQCHQEGHQWKHRGTGRHGSDKGDEYYTCTVCGTEKVE